MSLTVQPPLRFALALSLLLGAGALWLSTATPGRADSATSTQATTVNVPAAISFGGTNCGSRGDIPGTQVADFGSVAPGSSGRAPAGSGGGQAGSDYFLCVTSSMPYSITASGTGTLQRRDGATIPNADLSITSDLLRPDTNAHDPQDTRSCSTSTACPLDTARTTDSTTSTGTEKYDYNYRLRVPAGQAPGTYTGGQVTFTATTAANNP